MRKFKHISTNDWVDEVNDEYYKLQSDGRTIPKRFIEDSYSWVEYDTVKKEFKHRKDIILQRETYNKLMAKLKEYEK